MTEDAVMPEKKVTCYFKGGRGLEHPVDFNGREIKVGDMLSYDFHEQREIERPVLDWMRKPIFVVAYNVDKQLFFAQGINEKLYLHDFRFQYCEIVNE
jgi:hypothetical protein